MTLPQYKVWIDAVLRLLLGGVFVWAGALKLVDPQLFADRIAAFQLVPNGLINILALSLPPLEITSGILLITGWRRRTAALSILLMTGLFLVVLISARLRGLIVECGCFGDSFGSWGTDLTIARDLLLLLLSLYLYRGHHPKASEAAATIGEISN